MKPTDSAPDTRSILNQIYSLVGLTIIVSASIAGALIFRSAQVRAIESRASEYHLGTRLDISRIEFELNVLERNLLQSFVSDPADTAPLVDVREVQLSGMIMDRHSQSIVATQQQFGDSPFDLPVKRLADAIDALGELGSENDVAPIIDLSVLDLLSLIQRRCVQLDRLHAIAFRDRQDEVRGRNAWVSFAAWLALLVAIGCLSILLLLGYARRAIKRRARAEKALANRAVQAEYLHQAVSAATEATTVEQSLRQCIRVVCAMTDWPVGHAYLPSNTDPERLESTDVWYFSTPHRFTGLRETFAGSSRGKGEGLAGRVWESGDPQSALDIRHGDHFPSIKISELAELNQAFAIPVRADKKIIAVLEFFSAEKSDEDRTLMLMVRSVVDQFGLIIERKQAEERLRDMDAQLVHVARLKTMGEMVAGIAHEVNQPLAAIANYSLASKNILDATRYEFDVPIADWIQRINEQAVRCGDIIRSLRNYVTKGDDERTWVDLSRVANDSIALIASDLGKHSAVTECHLPSPGPRVLGVEVQLQQVLVNLLRNACDATSDVASPRIVVDLSFDNGVATLSVSDNGTGIEESQQLRLFDPFYTTKPEGMGMGLAICKTIVEAHEGKLWYERQGSVGSKFIVELPAVAAAGEENQIVA